jgi:uncharacterized paraquat-inducible protein A
VDHEEESDLGRQAVLRGLCTADQLEECLRLRSSRRPPPPLGDLLLYKGYLTPPQLEDLRSRRKKTMACPRCALTFTVLTRSDGSSARCTRCQGPLTDRGTEGRVPTDGRITTRRVQAAPPPVEAPAAGKKVTMVCVICESGFDWAPDASGRVRCPSCGSTFSARG